MPNCRRVRRSTFGTTAIQHCLVGALRGAQHRRSIRREASGVLACTVRASSGRNPASNRPRATASASTLLGCAQLPPEVSIAGSVKVLTGSDNAMSASTRTRNWHRALSRRAGGLHPGPDRFVRDRLHDRSRPTAIWPKPTSCYALASRADSRDANLSCVYDSAPRGSPKPRTLIIPPTLMDPDPDVPAGVVSWVRSRHAGGATLVSLCSGAFILAETGLVDGKSVATHQICAEALASRFPQIVVDAESAHY